MNNEKNHQDSIQCVACTANIEDIMAAFAKDGCVIIKNVLTDAQVKAVNQEIEPYLNEEKPGGPSGNTAENFYGKYTKRMEMVPARSRTFREQVLDLDILHNVCDAIFLESVGTYWLGLAQVIEIGPGNAAQVLHRDIQSNPAIMQLGPSGPETLINFFIALTEFTEENGATRIIPGSHRQAQGGSFNLWQEDVTGNTAVPPTLAAEMYAGDAVIYSGKALHGGGANRTTNCPRRGIAMPIQASFLTPVEAFPLTMNIDVARALPERVQSMLGFRSQHPKGSTGIWRAQAGELADYLCL